MATVAAHHRRTGTDQTKRTTASGLVAELRAVRVSQADDQKRAAGMSRETWRHTDAVEVPDVVGLSLPVARGTGTRLV